MNRINIMKTDQCAIESMSDSAEALDVVVDSALASCDLDPHIGAFDGYDVTTEFLTIKGGSC
ncbi:MAG: hypothetical protein CFE43_21320 [Burkholderiales bacterium PBB3]|nr:MAG: hypothetical protein CFE43_21320 [Burkholderiales bacterium PBB3]